MKISVSKNILYRDIMYIRYIFSLHIDRSIFPRYKTFAQIFHQVMKRFNSQFIKHKTNLIVILYLKALIYRKRNIATSSNELNVTRDCAIRRLVGFADQNLELFDSFFFIHSSPTVSLTRIDAKQ